MKSETTIKRTSLCWPFLFGKELWCLIGLKAARAFRAIEANLKIATLIL